MLYWGASAINTEATVLEALWSFSDMELMTIMLTQTNQAAGCQITDDLVHPIFLVTPKAWRYSCNTSREENAFKGYGKSINYFMRKVQKCRYQNFRECKSMSAEARSRFRKAQTAVWTKWAQEITSFMKVSFLIKKGAKRCHIKDFSSKGTFFFSSEINKRISLWS